MRETDLRDLVLLIDTSCVADDEIVRDFPSTVKLGVMLKLMLALAEDLERL